MHKKNLSYLIAAILLLLAITIAPAQVTIKGTVRNAATKEAIPFVNIGVRDKNVGTAANKYGSFSFEPKDVNKGDTLTFSAIGFQELALPISAILAENRKEFLLEEKATPLQEVVINSRAFKVRKFGTTSRNPLIYGSAETSNSSDISELANLIKMNGKPSELLSTSLYLRRLKIDSANFRINFLESVNGEPGGRIVEKLIVKRLPLDKGWLTVDLGEYGIAVDNDFFISFEYLPDPSHKEKYLFVFGGALGGSHFSRNVSLGAWEKGFGARMVAYVTVRQ